MKTPPKNIYPTMEITELPQCMPDDCKIEGNSVVAYRNYYIREKSYFANWKKRDVPHWFMYPNTIYEHIY